MILGTSHYHVETGRLLRVDFALDAPPWWRVPFHREYVSLNASRVIPRGQLRRNGPLWRVGPVRLLYLERDWNSLNLMFWVLNPITLLVWPFWRLLHLLERRVLCRFLALLWQHRIVIVPVEDDGRRIRYRDMWRYLWFWPWSRRARREEDRILAELKSYP